MLVLTRKLNQQIQLGNDITITVLRVKGNTIRLGIDAPREVRVVRGELERQNGAENGAENGAGKVRKPVAAATTDSAAEPMRAATARAKEAPRMACTSAAPLHGPLAPFVAAAVSDAVASLSA